jgi:hypothetical protein
MPAAERLTIFYFLLFFFFCFERVEAQGVSVPQEGGVAAEPRDGSRVHVPEGKGH